MANGSINVTEGSGKRLDTFDRTISSVLVQDQFVLPGEYPYASYIASGSNISCANSGDDLLQLMAGSSNYVRVRRIRIEQFALITSAATCSFQLTRLTTAGTGGGAVTPSKFDDGDAAAGATAATAVPTATKGTAGAVIWVRNLFPIQTASTAGTPTIYTEWVEQPGCKPLIIAAGTSHGIAIRNQGARAGLTVNIEIEFVETTWLGA